MTDLKNITLAKGQHARRPIIALRSLELQADDTVRAQSLRLADQRNE